MKRFVTLCIITSLFFVKVGCAALSLEVTQGMSAAIPIALIPFNNNNLASVAGNTTMTAVVHNDLQNSGQFKVIEPGLFDSSSVKLSQINYKHWQQRGVNNLILGAIKPLIDGRYQVRFTLLNVYTPKHPIIISDKFITAQAGLRNLAHHIANVIFQKLTGIRGVFTTKIAYVLVEGAPNEKPYYKLIVADQDGFNPQVLLASSEPIMSPTWTPNGKDLAYVSFEKHEASIYLQDLVSGQRRLISRFPGINGAPSFSPDGKRIAMVLSTTGNPKIYVFNMNTKKLSQVTSGYSIDTELLGHPMGSLLFLHLIEVVLHKSIAITLQVIKLSV